MPAEVLIHCIAGAVSPLDEDEGLVLEHINIRTGGKLGPHLLRPVAEELIGKDLGDHQDQLLLRQRDYLHPSIIMGWKQMIRSTRPWASSSSRWVELPSNRENSTMGNSA